MSLSVSIPQSEQGPAWGGAPGLCPPLTTPLCFSGSLGAMEEGEDAPAGQKSPSEREGAASDQEGSAEHDASSPPSSEGEQHLRAFHLLPAAWAQLLVLGVN